ncbi:MAG TPA: hypothetical protein VGC39_06400, partial [Candidatus Methylacidiphilales bacterium]
QERGERKALSPGHSRAVIEGIEPLNHLWRFNRGWLLDSQVRESLAYAVAGTPTFATIPKGLSPTVFPRAFWELRAVVELAPTVYLVADYLDQTQKHFVRFHVAHEQVNSAGNQVSTDIEAACHLKIIPLLPVEPPTLSVDRPTNIAKIPQEITTAVEYRGVTGPWSLFLLAALPLGETVKIFRASDAILVTTGDKTTRIELRAHGLLEVSREGDPHHVVLDAETLLGQLRAGSR